MGERDSHPRAARPGLWSRREVLGRGAAAGAVLTIPAVGTATVNAAVAAASPVARSALSADQSAILQAAIARLIPADANGPSGVDAGAAAYIEKALGGGLAGGLKAAAPLYQAGLAALDSYANSKFGAGFTSLSPDQQDSVLGDVEAGKAPGFVPDSKTFFAALMEHTLQGMFGDPVYGGNKQFAGWDLIGYPGVRMPVPANFQKIGVSVPKAHKSTYADGQFPKAKKEAQA